MPRIDYEEVRHFKGRFMGIAAEWDDIVAPEVSLASCRSISNAQCILDERYPSLPCDQAGVRSSCSRDFLGCRRINLKQIRTRNNIDDPATFKISAKGDPPALRGGLPSY